MLVSVVIPVYNRAAMAAEAVQSVLAQTWRDLECIVVDDGSTDGVAQMLSMTFSDSRLRLIRQDKAGVSAARNHGLAAAKGEIFALLDSDDLWLERKLERQILAMQNRGLAVCQTQERWMRKGRRVNPMRKHGKEDGDFFERAVQMCVISPSCAAFTRSFWEDAGPFDESLPACEDYDLWLRACARYTVGLVDEELAIRRGGRPDQLSQQFIGLDLYRIYALVKLLRAEPLTRPQRAAAQRELARKVRVYAQGCLKRDKPEEALRIREYAADVLAPQEISP